MIFYKNPKKHKKTTEKDLTFSVFDDGLVSNVDDSVSKANGCKSFYNLTYVDGALKTGLGFRDLQVPATLDDLKTCHTFDFASSVDEIIGIWVNRWYNTDVEEYQYQLMLMDANFKLWQVPLIDEFEGHVWTKSEKLTSYPTYECTYRTDNKDCFLFFSEEGMLYLAAYAEGVYTSVPAMISCVVHYDNFFGITNTNRNTLIYTKNVNLTEWQENEESSTIEFLDNRGAFNKLVAFNDYVYLFREYGITKISIYTSKNDFSFTHLYSSSSKIYENSVCVCGDKVLFFTRDGLYDFNGNSVDKIAGEYDKYFKNLSNENCSAACLNGKYYFATKCNFEDGEMVGCESDDFVNNVLFEVDINDYCLNVYRGVDIRKILAVDNPFTSKLCACFYGDNKQRIGELDFSGDSFETATAKCWTSFVSDLGFKGKKKRIKEVIISSLFDCEVEIQSDFESKTYKIFGSEKEQRLRVNVAGKKFQFSFKTNASKCDIKKPMVVFDVVT